LIVRRWECIGPVIVHAVRVVRVTGHEVRICENVLDVRFVSIHDGVVNEDVVLPVVVMEDDLSAPQVYEPQQLSHDHTTRMARHSICTKRRSGSYHGV
jgi:hypothetical protein